MAISATFQSGDRRDGLTGESPRRRRRLSESCDIAVIILIVIFLVIIKNLRIRESRAHRCELVRIGEDKQQGCFRLIILFHSC
jgi:hypothetical protein